MTLITTFIMQSTKKVLEIWSWVANAIAKLRLKNQPPLLVISNIKSVNSLQQFYLILDKETVSWWPAATLAWISCSPR